MSKEIRISETSPNTFIGKIVECVHKGYEFVPNTFYTNRVAHNVVFLDVTELKEPEKAVEAPEKVVEDVKALTEGEGIGSPKISPKKRSTGRKTTSKISGGESK